MQFDTMYYKHAEYQPIWQFMAFTHSYSNLLRRQLILSLTALLLAISGCSINKLVHGSHYVHRVYQHPAAKAAQDQSIAVVFIEGDGIPWVTHGTKPAADPTPNHALARNLFTHTTYASWYVTRPCYNRPNDLVCEPNVWTHGRYSAQVAESMASVINDQIESSSARRVVLVGYSGGGTLAVLIASHINHLAGVITIAANLDTLAWTTLHAYEPLTNSLNPVDSASLAVPHLAYVGDRDLNVPYPSIAGFVETHPQTIIEHVSTYDHVCCWEKNWPVLLNTALAKMQIIR